MTNDEIEKRAKEYSKAWQEFLKEKETPAETPVIIYADNSGETYGKPSWSIPCGIIGAVILCATIISICLYFWG